MPDILKPDAKAVVWLAIGFFVAPMVVGLIKRKMPS